MRVTDLNFGWKFRPVGLNPPYPRPQVKDWPWLDASVPGNVHLDLLANGVIANPLTRAHELGVQWIESSGWEYQTEFEYEENSTDSAYLQFDGLDTVCQIHLNDEQIVRHDNHFLPAAFDVKSKLREGRNVLRVEFSSAVKTGQSRRADWCEQHGVSEQTVHFDERAFVRKPGYSFGWDWGPRLVGCGIFLPVRLVELSGQFCELDVSVAPDRESFLVRANVHPELSADVEFEFVPGDESTTVERLKSGPAECCWRVSGALWWPRGYGEQILHTVRANLPNGQELSRRIGLRTIELRREIDEFGESFCFFVNGVQFWARGANWIPDDVFLSRCTTETIRSQIDSFSKLGMNMLRVWGGGEYESDDFYNSCDELGILVWQDFPFACMYYPDDEPWQKGIEDEARFHARRLRHHASLALWCGNNENLMMWQGKWGVGTQPSRFLGESIYDNVLPQVLAELDPQRAYVRSSPIGEPSDETIPAGAERNANMGDYGDSHYWEVWHGKGDWIHYKDSTARFSSEFGFASSCSLDAWQTCLPAEAWEMFPHPEFLHHDKTGKPWEDFRSLVELHYPPIRSLVDWTYYSQLNQRDALRYAIEHYRRSEFCKGTLIWQANDCWPVQSWSIQDSSRLIKPAGFELRRLYAGVMLSIDFSPGQTNLNLWICNDSRTDSHVLFSLDRFDVQSGNLVPVSSQQLTSQSNSRILFESYDVSRDDPIRTAYRLQLSGDADDERWIWLCEPKSAGWPPPVVSLLNGDPSLLDIVGLAPDLVIWDPENQSNLLDAACGLPGWSAQTILHSQVNLNWQSPPRTIAWRSLAGHGILTVPG